MSRHRSPNWPALSISSTSILDTAPRPMPLVTALTVGSAARYQPATMMHHPQLDGGNDRHNDADHDVNPHCGGVGEAEDPGRYQDPEPHDQIEPFLPLGECC